MHCILTTLLIVNLRLSSDDLLPVQAVPGPTPAVTDSIWQGNGVTSNSYHLRTQYLCKLMDSPGIQRTVNARGVCQIQVMCGRLPWAVCESLLIAVEVGCPGLA